MKIHIFRQGELIDKTPVLIRTDKVPMNLENRLLDGQMLSIRRMDK